MTNSNAWNFRSHESENHRFIIGFHSPFETTEKSPIWYQNRTLKTSHFQNGCSCVFSGGVASTNEMNGLLWFSWRGIGLKKKNMKWKVMFFCLFYLMRSVLKLKWGILKLKNQFIFFTLTISDLTFFIMYYFIKFKSCEVKAYLNFKVKPFFFFLIDEVWYGIFVSCVIEVY